MNTYNNKTRILLILDILKKNTDEDHALKAADIIGRINAEGLKCDRKTLYDDIASLTDAGVDIIHEAGGGYKLLSRDFEDAEIRLLIDAVYSSKFISSQKTKVLAGKLKSLTSESQASSITRQIYSSDSKTPNEDVLYSVDSLSRALQDNKQVSFEYLVWGANKKLVTKGEKTRILSPWALIWQDQNYYLMAYDEAAGKMKHFRVDKMRHVSVTDEPRCGREVFESIDMSEYVEETFSMYGGRQETVTFDFPEQLIGIAYDRFGTEITQRPGEKGHILVRTKCYVSNQFYGWLSGLGGDVRIVSPESAVDAYRMFLKDLIKKY
ncbi:MAG: WYL domain-containing transcriptional regulator [Lachnospiraceae bacterium]|nr:WYL domain-containing transcriptional regulator [Lachnospiraceae bacterium]